MGSIIGQNNGYPGNYINPNQMPQNQAPMQAPMMPAQYPQAMPMGGRVPQQNSMPAPVPSASAVSINIINPQAYAGSPNSQNQTSQSNSPYNYPANPIYGYNNAPYYNIPNNQIYNQPPMTAPQVNRMPIQPQMQQSATVIPQMIQPQQVMSPQMMQEPVQPQMIPQQMSQEPVQPQMYQQSPIVPPPSMIDQQQIPQIPEQATQMNQPAAQPGIQQNEQVQPGSTQQAPSAEQTPPQPEINIQAINQALISPNTDEQAVAIQKIAELGQSSPEQSAGLLNEETFKGLTNVITKDISTLQGPEKEKAVANKTIGMWTLAILQKNFRELMNAEAEKQGIPPIAVNNLPGIVPIVNNIKSDPNPTIRAAGISALSYIAKPEDKPVLSVIYQNAMKDKNPNIRIAAQQALSSLGA